MAISLAESLYFWPTLKNGNASLVDVAASVLLGCALVVGEEAVGVVLVDGKAAVRETDVGVFFDPHEARTSAAETNNRRNRFLEWGCIYLQK